MREFVRKSILLISILGSIAMIYLLAYLFVHAFSYWRENFPLGYPKDAIAFYTAVFVAITTVTFQWIEGRIKSIIECITLWKVKGGASHDRQEGSRVRITKTITGRTSRSSHRNKARV